MSKEVLDYLLTVKLTTLSIDEFKGEVVHKLNELHGNNVYHL